MVRSLSTSASGGRDIEVWGRTGCDAALETLPADMKVGENAALMKKAYSTLIICLGDHVLREVTKETTAAGIWTKLTSLYITKSLANRLYLKKKLYTYYMSPNIVVWEGILDNGGCSGNSEFKGVEERTEGIKKKLVTEGHLKRDCLMKKSSGFIKKGKHDQDSDSSDDEGNAYFGEALVVVGNDEMTELVMDLGGSYHMTRMRDFLYDFKVVNGGSVQLGLRRNLISLGTLEKERYTVKMQMGRIKVIKGCRVMMTRIRKKNYVYTLEAKVMTFGVQKHGGSKQAGLKQLGSKQFEVELQGAQENRKAEVFQVSNDDVAVAQRRLEDKQLEEKTNTDCLVKEKEKIHLGIKVGANIMVTEVPGQKGAEGNVVENKKVNESVEANLGKLLKYNTWSTRWSPVRVIFMDTAYVDNMDTPYWELVKRQLNEEFHSRKEKSEQVKVVIVEHEGPNSPKKLKNLHRVSFLYVSREENTNDQLPTNESNPGHFTLPCTISNFNFYAMADLGASVNVLPRNIFEYLELTNLSETEMLVELADMRKKAPLGIVRDILVKNEKFPFPSDFVILDQTPNSTVILGRLFLATVHAQISVFEK
ncbi:zinc finger, CCHC-type containing protein [Tanacetum coccineum]